jgi:periplasmic divalent cation tolerance protein
VSRIVTVYATFASADEAASIARILIEERLAACANILGPCRSIYRWQGKAFAGEPYCRLPVRAPASSSGRRRSWRGRDRGRRAGAHRHR